MIAIIDYFIGSNYLLSSLNSKWSFVNTGIDNYGSFCWIFTWLKNFSYDAISGYLISFKIYTILEIKKGFS